MDYFNEIAAKLQDAANLLDNFEASNRLDADQIDLWLMARTSIIKAMGEAVALEMTMEGESA